MLLFLVVFRKSVGSDLCINHVNNATQSYYPIMEACCFIVVLGWTTGQFLVDPFFFFLFCLYSMITSPPPNMVIYFIYNQYLKGLACTMQKKIYRCGCGYCEEYLYGNPMESGHVHILASSRGCS